MRHRSLLSSTFVTLLLAGCPAGGDVALEDVPEALAPAYCDLLDRCGNPFVTAVLTAGGDCQTSILPALEDSFVGRAEGAIATGRVIYHGELVNGCIAGFDAAGCDVSALGDVCTDVFEGTIPAGGDCGWDEECIEGYCSTVGGVCPGTCANRVAAGEACAAAEACPVGYSCADGVCVAQARLGEACGSTTGLSCRGIDLNCVGSTPTEPGTCQTWASVFSGAVGSSCTLTGQDFCDEGLSCVYDGVTGGMATFVCAAPVARGAACSSGFPDPCPDDQYCQVDGSPMGTCADLPTAGMTCAGTCAPGLRCVTLPTDAMLCVNPARLGSACTVDEECVSNSCQAGICASPGC